MKRILSRSVTATPNQEPGPVISGTLHTDPSFEPTSGVFQALIPLVELRVKAGTHSTIFTVLHKPDSRIVVQPYTRRWLFRLVEVYNRVIHAVGFHTMLPHETWNPDTGEALESGYVCVLCLYEEED